MKNTFFKLLFIVNLFLFISCKNETSVNLNNNSSAKLTVTALDNSGKPITNANVQITSYMAGSGSAGNITLTIADGRTNSKGIFSKNLLQGQYLVNCIVDSGIVPLNNSQAIQIIGSEDQSISMTPLKQNGYMKLLINSTSGNVLAGYNVALIAREPNNSNNGITNNFDDLMNFAFKTGKTDQNGLITFTNLPISTITNVRFHVLVYRDQSNYAIYNQVVFVSNPLNSFYVDDTNVISVNL